MLYGHTARVWDSRLLPDCVISVGEDATCRVWGYGGECLQVVEGHRGRSIWSMAVDESSGLVVRIQFGIRKTSCLYNYEYYRQLEEEIVVLDYSLWRKNAETVRFS